MPHLSYTQVVGGSNPSAPTIFYRGFVTTIESRRPSIIHSVIQSETCSAAVAGTAKLGLMKRTLILAASIAGAFAQSFQLDQGFDTSNTSGFSIREDRMVYQTFTVGLEGLLSQVNVKLYYLTEPDTSVRLVIFNPDGFDYASETLPSSSVPSGYQNAAMVPFTLSSPVGMRPGETWGIRLEITEPVSSGPTFTWVGDTTQPYTGGDGGTWPNLPAGGDFAFQTFVLGQTILEDPTPIGASPQTVPEPSTYAALFALGLLGFAGVRRYSCWRRAIKR
jgi:hypothetical protein